MLQVVKGVYENGQIVLDEKPAVKPHTKVLVTFLDDENFETTNVSNSSKTNSITFGSLKGKISVPDDFDEPLEDLKDYMQ